MLQGAPCNSQRELHKEAPRVIPKWIYTEPPRVNPNRAIPHYCPSCGYLFNMFWHCYRSNDQQSARNDSATCWHLQGTILLEIM